MRVDFVWASFRPKIKKETDFTKKKRNLASVLRRKQLFKGVGEGKIYKNNIT
jgi:hypothetical protein